MDVRSRPVAYAGLLRPVVDRVFVTVKQAARDRMRAVHEAYGLGPGLEVSFGFGLLARPLPGEAFAAATVYAAPDMSGEPDRGVVTVGADGSRRLTALGREVTLELERVTGEVAAQTWDRQPIVTMPGLAAVPRLVELVGRVLAAGRATGGPAFLALAPPYEPDDATPARRLMGRLGALRHHRGDAHRAAWRAAGLTLDELRSLAPDEPRRRAVEEATNRRDAVPYAALDEAERLELLAGLGALPG